MTLLRIILLLTLVPSLSLGQNWMRSQGGDENDEALALSSDGNNNVYATGYFSDKVFFNGVNTYSFGYDDIFITKTNAAGAIQWVRTFGGSQPDRAYGIASDASGNTVVTGYVTGNFNVAGTTYSTYGGGQDLVAVKYDALGNVQWVKTFGGPDIEIGYDASFDQNGNIILVGQFKDTAYFDGYTLISEIDPNTGDHSPDIFIVKLDQNGNVIWAKEGNAPYEDRALAVAVDGSNNLYVTGQFSDTLTFSNTYTNNMINAGFIMKLDPVGNELWFTRMGASYVVPYDLVATPLGDVYITGDFGGLMIFVVGSNPTLSTGYGQSFFVAQFNTSGDLMWYDADGSHNEISSRAIDLDPQGDVYVTGYFECSLSEYTAEHDSAIFQSVGFRDIFISKFDGSGNGRVWERHLGGPQDDYSSGIAALSVDNPAIAGSYADDFNTPAAPTATTYSENVDNTSNGPNPAFFSYCGSPTYGNFLSVHSEGHKDIYIARPIDLSAPIYDYYTRSGSQCIRDILEGDIENGLDTIFTCVNSSITMNTYTGMNGLIGPEYMFSWASDSGGTSSNQSMTVTTSGYYWCTVSRTDVCPQPYTDSIFVVIVNESITAEIESDYVDPIGAIPQGSCKYKMIVWQGDTAQLWSNLDLPGQIVQWVTTLGTIYADTINAYVGGHYSLIVSDSVNGCSKDACVEIVLIDLLSCNGTGQCNASTFSPMLLHGGAPVDTVEVCQGDSFCLNLVDSTAWSQGLGGQVNAFASWNISSNISYQPYPYGYDTTFIQHTNCFSGGTSGWVTIITEFFMPLSGISPVVDTFSFYLLVNPLPPAGGTIQGPSYMCDTDTVLLVATSNASFSWSGPGIIWTSTAGDSVYVDDYGMYSIGANVYDTLTGCANSFSSNHSISAYPEPQITAVPGNGLICPGDSVLLSGDSGVGWEWIGPQGNILDTTQSVYVHEPGFYYYNHHSNQGCYAVSEWFEVVEYATPFIEAFPGTQLCAGGTVDITVITNGASSLQWGPPLNDTSQTVTIDTTGAYTATVSYCGITTSVSINITSAPTMASIDIVSDTLICPGDTVMMQANPGMLEYSWSNGDDTPTIFVTDSGYYTVTTLDQYGCYGQSDSVYIAFHQQPNPPVANDTVVCIGSAVTLMANSDTVQWFTGQNYGSFIHQSDSVFVPNVLVDTIFYIAVSDSICYSDMVPITAFVNQSSVAPQIYGDTSACFGESFIMYTDSLPGFAFQWIAPNGDTTGGPFLMVTQADSSHIGQYQLMVSDSFCSGPSSSVNFFVNPLPEPFLSITDTMVCPGEFVEVFVQGINPDSDASWYPTGFNTDTVSLVGTGLHYALITDRNGCEAYSDTFLLENYTLPVIPGLSDTAVCYNSDAQFQYTGPSTSEWYDGGLNLLETSNTLLVSGITSPTTIILALSDSNNCYSVLDSFAIDIIPSPVQPVLAGPDTICEGASFSILGGNSNYEWILPSGQYYTGAQVSVFSAGVTHSGDYYAWQLTPEGCPGDTAIFTLFVQPLPAAPSVVSPLNPCEGDDFVLDASSNGATDYAWNGPGMSNQNGSQVIVQSADSSHSGIYTVTPSINGCDGPNSTVTVNVQFANWASLLAYQEVCLNDPATLVLNNTQYTVDWYYYSQLIGQGQSTTFNHTNIGGSHFIDVVAEDMYGCEFTYEDVEVFVHEPSGFGLGADTSICEDQRFIILDPGSGFNSYLWQDSSTFQTFFADSVGVYYVSVEYGSIGCVATDSIIVTEIDCDGIMTNVFTPNGDGLNDTWSLEVEGARSMLVEIYNRWGDLIYILNEDAFEWDGTNLNNDKMCSEGTYFYVGNIVSYNGRPYTFKGTVHLFVN